MNRKIRFRAWDKRFNIMIYQLADGYRLAFDGTIQVVGDSGSTFRVSEEFVLMQYTGYEDWENTEIYEDSIISFTIFDYNDSDTQHVGVVKFNQGQWQIWPNNESQYWSSDGAPELDWVIQQDSELKVIGTIHEHPSLLENEK